MGDHFRLHLHDTLRLGRMFCTDGGQTLVRAQKYDRKGAKHG